MPRHALFTLAFAAPPPVTGLGWRHVVTRRIILQKARDHASPEGARALTAWTRSVSGSLSLPSPGCFSPFPHGTVHYRSRLVSCLGLWSAQLPTGFHVSRGTRDPRHGQNRCVYGTITRSGPASQPVPRHAPAPLSGTHSRRQVSQPHQRNACMLEHADGLGGHPVRSPLLRVEYYFLQLLRCFSSLRSLPRTWVTHQQCVGLPHSETMGSVRGCRSPILSPLTGVLHRLVVPRHPPTAHSVLPGLWKLGST